MTKELVNRKIYYYTHGNSIRHGVANSEEPDQLASGSTLFAIQYSN